MAEMGLVMTPAKRFLIRLAQIWFKRLNWQIVGQLPALPKYVLILAPHTSIMDFPIGVAALSIISDNFDKVRVAIMMKEEMFWGPAGPFFRWLGVIPIRRRTSQNMVQQMIEAFRVSDRLTLVITPEGTRSKAKHWKTGFYHIACGANVPIVCAFLDFKHKRCGFGPVIRPTGDLEADMVPIREFYSGMTGKHPELFGEITFQPERPRIQPVVKAES